MRGGFLFAGIGGFELAAIQAGIEPVWSNEINPWCCKVLRKNFDHEIIEKDIRLLTADTISIRGQEKIRDISKRKKPRISSKPVDKNATILQHGNKTKLQKVDIITGGFPCQPFSHAGKRKGTDDDRYLWPEMLRIIEEVGPSWVIGENVAGLKSMENGRTLDRILTDLEDIGFDTETFLIPACSVGAWHRRDRIWIVSHTRHVPNTNEKRQCNQEQIRELERQRLSEYGERYGRGKEWQTEPAVGRMANGIPGRVDRLKGLGNAIVPQVAYEIFKAITQNLYFALTGKELVEID